jgi:UDP-N-acetylmuramate dehydrogenase
MLIREHAELRHLNTFHVSASARWFAAVTTNGELQEVLDWARARQQSFMLIGQGSNILFKQDYPGLIIELHTRGIVVVAQTDAYVDVEAMGGEVWHDFVQWCLAQGWYGLENLSLIPGTVGAAPVQNIGAYGVEVKDTLLSLEAVEIATGRFRRFSNAECAFAYRNSVFKQGLQGQYVICSVRFRLSKQPTLNLEYPALRQALAGLDAASLTPRAVSDAVCKIRRSKLPDHRQLGNAGSFFWNPHVSREQFSALQARWPALPGYPDGEGVKIPAAWLIEQAGWKGYRDGDVGVHSEHALVLVNHGQATGAELVALSGKIQDSVQQRFGIRLEPEVRIV